MSQHLPQSTSSQGGISLMSNVSSANVVINNIAITGPGQRVKPYLFGGKPRKMKASDNFASFKLIKTSSRKETQKSAATHLNEKREIVSTANEIIKMANDNFQDSNTQIIQLYNAGMKAAETSHKQHKQAAAKIVNLEKKIGVLENKLTAKKNKLTAKNQEVDKLTSEVATLKRRRRR